MKLLTPLLLLLFISCAHSPKKGFNKELDGYEYPFEVKMFKFNSQSQDLEMSYMDINPSQNKVFVLFHGKNFNAAYFEDTAKFLSKNGFRVILIDQLGFGKSSKPLHYQYTFQQLAVNTHNLLKSLRVDSFYLLGHSMGGMLATRYSLMYPNEVQKLFLLNPIGLEDWKLVIPYPTIDQNYQAELKKTNEALRQYQVKSYYDNKWKESYERWLSPLIGWNEGIDHDHMAMVAALTSDMVITQPVIYEFPKLKVKTVLMIGNRDRTAIGKNLVSSEMAKKMGRYDLLAPKIKKMIPNSKLIIFKNIGHLPHIEDYDNFTKKLQKEL